ncbi:MAG: class I SAM-dependent methyltransferase, partial [Candidatus Omnitrophica bacterium]|nr:class I SAM-dependent methyltransferase [Candidatus Omnitrophota bacterium]
MLYLALDDTVMSLKPEWQYPSPDFTRVRTGIIRRLLGDQTIEPDQIHAQVTSEQYSMESDMLGASIHIPATSWIRGVIDTAFQKGIPVVFATNRSQEGSDVTKAILREMGFDVDQFGFIFAGYGRMRKAKEIMHDFEARNPDAATKGKILFMDDSELNAHDLFDGDNDSGKQRPASIFYLKMEKKQEEADWAARFRKIKAPHAASPRDAKKLELDLLNLILDITKGAERVPSLLVERISSVHRAIQQADETTRRNVDAVRLYSFMLETALAELNPGNMSIEDLKILSRAVVEFPSESWNFDPLTQTTLERYRSFFLDFLQALEEPNLIFTPIKGPDSRRQPDNLPVSKFHGMLEELLKGKKKFRFANLYARTGTVVDNMKAFVNDLGLEDIRGVSANESMIAPGERENGHVKMLHFDDSREMERAGLTPNSQDLIIIHSLVNTDQLEPGMRLLREGGILYVTFAQSDIDTDYRTIKNAAQAVIVKESLRDFQFRYGLLGIKGEVDLPEDIPFPGVGKFEDHRDFVPFIPTHGKVLVARKYAKFPAGITRSEMRPMPVTSGASSNLLGVRSEMQSKDAAMPSPAQSNPEVDWETLYELHREQPERFARALSGDVEARVEKALKKLFQGSGGDGSQLLADSSIILVPGFGQNWQELKVLAERFPRCNILGVDWLQNNIDLAKANLHGGKSKNITFLKKNIAELNLKNISMVYVSYLLDIRLLERYANDPNAARIAEILFDVLYRQISPGGYFVALPANPVTLGGLQKEKADILLNEGSGLETLLVARKPKPRAEMRQSKIPGVLTRSHGGSGLVVVPGIRVAAEYFFKFDPKKFSDAQKRFSRLLDELKKALRSNLPEGALATADQLIDIFNLSNYSGSPKERNVFLKKIKSLKDDLKQTLDSEAYVRMEYLIDEQLKIQRGQNGDRNPVGPFVKFFKAVIREMLPSGTPEDAQRSGVYTQADTILQQFQILIYSQFQCATDPDQQLDMLDAALRKRIARADRDLKGENYALMGKAIIVKGASEAILNQYLGQNREETKKRLSSSASVISTIYKDVLISPMATKEELDALQKQPNEKFRSMYAKGLYQRKRFLDTERRRLGNKEYEEKYHRAWNLLPDLIDFIEGIIAEVAQQGTVEFDESESSKVVVKIDQVIGVGQFQEILDMYKGRIAAVVTDSLTKNSHVAAVSPVPILIVDPSDKNFQALEKGDFAAIEQGAEGSGLAKINADLEDRARIEALNKRSALLEWAYRTVVPLGSSIKFYANVVAGEAIDAFGDFLQGIGLTRTEVDPLVENEIIEMIRRYNKLPETERSYVKLSAGLLDIMTERYYPQAHNAKLRGRSNKFRTIDI